MVLLGLIAGLTLTIAGACATNNYLDRGIDAKMKRTKNRALVSGVISAAEALVFATVTTITGLLTLAVTQNSLTTLLAAIAWFAYVVLYGLGKRYTVHGTLIGCISGSIPLVAGYTAATGHFDYIAWQLFALMTAWQMAHFYGIALYRLADYRMAQIPVMPAVYGVRSTQVQTIGYITVFILVTVWMAITDSLTVIAAGLLIVLSLFWLMQALIQLPKLPSEVWGRKVFLSSLIVVLGMSLCLVANPLLPL